MPQPTLEFAGFKISPGTNDVEINRCEGIAVISLRGRLDSVSSVSVLDCVHWLLESGESRLIIDCQHLDSISSAGLAALVKSNGRLSRPDASLAIAGPRGLAAQTLRLTRLNRLLAIFPDVESAAQSLQSRCVSNGA